MSTSSGDNATSPDEELPQSDPPQSPSGNSDDGQDAPRSSSWWNATKWFAATVWSFVRRQKVPAFLLFYRDHWREVVTYIRDGYSVPADSELWIRESDHSPGLYREGTTWDIDAASCCVICGASRETERRRVRSVVYDFDGMIYGVLAAILGAVVIWFATDSILIAIGVFIGGLWGARKLVVEEQVCMHCSVCPKHDGEEQSLLLRLKRETLIIELGSRKARLSFLRKSRETSGQNPWESHPAPGEEPDTALQTPPPRTVAPVLTMPLASSSDSEQDVDLPDPSAGDSRPNPTIPLPRIPLADLDNDDAPAEMRAFSLHSSDGQLVDGPIVSDSETEEPPVDHYFQADVLSEPEGERDSDVEDFEFQPAEPENVVIPVAPDQETIPLAGPVPHEAQTEDSWYCRIDGVEIGPVPLEQAQRLKTSGTLKATDAVRPASADDWAPPESLPAMTTASDSPSADDRTDVSGSDPWADHADDSSEPWDPWAE